MKLINAFDFDGVVSLGIHPGPEDIIITGRAIDEVEEVYAYLNLFKILVPVYFNPITKENRGTGSIEARTCSAKHKSNIVSLLERNGVCIHNFFEDDPVQWEIIEKDHPNINLIRIISDTKK